MSDEPPTSSDTAGDMLGLAAIRELLRMLEQTDVSEISIEHQQTKVHIKRGWPDGSAQSAASPPEHWYAAEPPEPPSLPFMPTPGRAQAPMPSYGDSAQHYILKAPMVGTFYAAPTPEESPFVQAGDMLAVGDTVGIIEALQARNEIETDTAGQVVRLLVDDGQPVEYGQALLIIDPLL